MLVLICLITGGILIGLAWMQYKADNQLAPVSLVFGIVIVIFGLSGSPARFFMPSEVRRFETVEYNSFLGYKFNIRIPPDENEQGEPNYWVNFMGALNTSDWQRHYDFNTNPPRYTARGDRSMWSCFNEAFEVGGYTVCQENGFLHFLATDEMRQWVAAINRCETRCNWIRGRMNIDGDIQTAPFVYELPQTLIQAFYNKCLQPRVYNSGAYMEMKRPDGTWIPYTGAEAWGDNHGRAIGFRVTNTNVLPVAFGEGDRLLRGYMHQANPEDAYICFY